MKNTLIVSEVFYSIQGEGPTTGIPAVFLRLAGCNLLCKSESWVCDTIEVWKKGRSVAFCDVLNPARNEKVLTCEDMVAHLKRGAHLVITGGEPLMQQDYIVNYLNWFREVYKFTPYVEVETNGTIIPSQHMLDKVDQWNVSPKLANSGEPYSKRCNDVAISTILTYGRNKVFKFVIEKEEDFVFGIQDEYGHLVKNSDNIVLMPAGDSVKALEKTRVAVVDICKKYGVRFTDRLHISLWDKKTGV